jgi:hypothetical protein
MEGEFMKLKMLLLTLGFLVSVPGFSEANGNLPNSKGGNPENAPCDCQEGKHHHNMHRDWQAHMAEKDQKLLLWVDQFSPDKKAEWTKVLAEKKTLSKDWMSPENAGKREQWKKAKLAKMEELKKQFDEGKLTKEEFIKKAHDGKEMGHWKTFHDLRISVEKKDEKQAKVLLNQLLVQTKQHNQRLKEMLKKE